MAFYLILDDLLQEIKYEREICIAESEQLQTPIQLKFFLSITLESQNSVKRIANQRQMQGRGSPPFLSDWMNAISPHISRSGSGVFLTQFIFTLFIVHVFFCFVQVNIFSYVADDINFTTAIRNFVTRCSETGHIEGLPHSTPEWLQPCDHQPVTCILAPPKSLSPVEAQAPLRQNSGLLPLAEKLEAKHSTVESKSVPPVKAKLTCGKMLDC